MDARVAHQLHHDGHHVHDKTSEEYYYTAFHYNLNADWQFLVDVPYVIRRSIEIDNHAHLGAKQKSEGLGDVTVLGVRKFYTSRDFRLGALGGVKLPTGETENRTGQGLLFEPELQPGSGSDDYPVGMIYEWSGEKYDVRGNILYFLKTEGDHDFQYGDLFSTALFVRRKVMLRDVKPAKIGLDINWQSEARHEEDGIKMADSGGDTLFVGPMGWVALTDNASIEGNVLFPVYQNLGGTHQHLEFTWQLACRISW